jgi:Family of unknown function (DUF6526)
MYHRHARQIRGRPARKRENPKDEGNIPMPTPQSAQSHTRWDPLFHFFVLPALLLNIFFAIFLLVHHWPIHSVPLAWWVFLSIVLFIGVGKSRGNALKAQDRIIRLEEKLRLAALLPADELKRSHALTESQLIALRFASDDELPALARRAVDEKLSAKEIKQSINRWRPDYFRV